MHGTATRNIYPLSVCFKVNSNTSYRLTIAELVERLDDDLTDAGSSLLCTTIFLLTRCGCWYTFLQLETHSQNDRSVVNQIKYIGLRQDSYFKCKLLKS